MSRRNVIKRAKIARGRRLAILSWHNMRTEMAGDSRIPVDDFTMRVMRRILKGLGS